MNDPAEADDGFDELAALCDRLVGFDDTLHVHHVDGWLTAMAAGPVRLATEDWLQRLFGDTFERTFADPADHERALAVLQRRLRALHGMLDAEALLDRPDELRLDPFFDDWTDDDRRRLVDEGHATAEEASALQAGSLWAEGVLDGLDDLAGVWQLPEDDDSEFGRAYAELVDQVSALLLGPDDADWRAFVERYHRGTAPARDDLLTNACFAVQDLRLLLDHGPKPEPRRVGPQPGRNDPCPCGSGKKFKKCHGATA